MEQFELVTENHSFLCCWPVLLNMNNIFFKKQLGLIPSTILEIHLVYKMKMKLELTCVR